ncbi:MAG: glycosyltransferase [Myxococcales bacterium]|nr:glycosyltransferase [Myxococcales bacterium]
MAGRTGPDDREDAPAGPGEELTRAADPLDHHSGARRNAREWSTELETSLRQKEISLEKAVSALKEGQARAQSLEQQVSVLSQWLDHARQGFASILGSKRWRLGNRLIGTLGRLVGRPGTPPLVQQIQDTFRNFEQWRTHRESDATEPLDIEALTASTLPNARRDAINTIARSQRYDVVFLANIDWRERFQRPQQIATQFAHHGHRVFYVVASNPLSIEHPRGYESERVAWNTFEVRLAAPRPIDRYASVLDAETTEAFFNSLQPLIRDFRISSAVSVVHLPFWTPLALLLQKDRLWPLVYDCMDEWAGFPHIGEAQIRAERELVAQADLVTVSAGRLEEKWREAAAACVLVRNGVDAEFFADSCRPNDVLKLSQRPIVGFYGALAEWIDLDLIAFLARSRPNWSFVLLGDIFVDDLRGLDAIDNVHLLGRKPFEDMPRYLYHFDVCMIPFVLDDVTQAVDPVKFYEFISVGKPVVATALSELEIYSEHLYLARTREEFLDQLDRASAERDPARRRNRVALAKRNSWKLRYEVMHEAIARACPKVSVIIVAYKNEDLTRLCVESVLAETLYPNLEVIVVDNASPDGTANTLRYYEMRDHRITVILNDENRGFAAANNQGLAIAEGEFIVLLNNDTVVPRGWLLPLLRHLQDPEIGMVGPVTNFAGNEAKIDVPYPSLEEMPDFAADRMQEKEGRCFDIEVLAMFCVMLRRDVFDSVGPLDEDFKIGMFEDDDYSRRVRERGYRTVCAEDAFVHHFGQAAFKDLLASGEYQTIWDANQAHFEKKWGKWEAHRHRDGSAPRSGA